MHSSHVVGLHHVEFPMTLAKSAAVAVSESICSSCRPISDLDNSSVLTYWLCQRRATSLAWSRSLHLFISSPVVRSPLTIAQKDGCQAVTPRRRFLGRLLALC